jgi:adenylate kinase
MSLYIIMMGVQGAGKGLQAAIISEGYGIPHVSTGDIFRGMQQRNDELAREVKTVMESGGLVSDELTCRIVADRLEQDDAANGVILDGFPRNENQAKWLDEYLTGKGEQVTAVVWMELDPFVAFKRAFGRVTDTATGDSYNLYYKTDGISEWHFEEDPDGVYVPRLVVTLENGNPVKRRADDANAHAVITRIDNYMQSTAPLLDYYRAQDRVLSVNADQSIEAVSADIKTAVDARR